MTFKELANELMDQGWRCYKIPNLPRGLFLESLAVRNFLEVMVYEGKSLVFVKDIPIPEEEENDN